MEENFLLPNECIICLESNDTNNPIININYIHKDCNCNSPIHKECLNKWYTFNKRCPICRNIIYDEENTIESRNVEYCNCIESCLQLYCNNCCCIIILIIFCICIFNTPVIKHLKL